MTSIEKYLHKINLEAVRSECEQEIIKAYKDGYKKGYLDNKDINYGMEGDIRKSWFLGYNSGQKDRKENENNISKSQI